MNTVKKFIPLSLLTATALLLQACGGSKETSSAPSASDAPSAPSAPAEVKEVASSAPTMENMKTAVVDAIQTISTNTVAEITQLAKDQKAIEIPESFEKVQSALASAGQSELFTGLSSSLNSSAMGAIGDYKKTLEKTIGNLNIPAIETVMKGCDTSITQFLESTASSQIKEGLVPYIKEAAKEYGAQDWIDKIKGALPEDTGGLLGKVSAATGVQLPTNFDVESYLSDEIMGKFFDVMANQEKLFRQNPTGRSAELFKKVMEVAQ